jgi:hypothetical protein
MSDPCERLLPSSKFKASIGEEIIGVGSDEVLHISTFNYGSQIVLET